eukprot:1161585-Pelagomonas_calceolata.AAC.7
MVYPRPVIAARLGSLLSQQVNRSQFQAKNCMKNSNAVLKISALRRLLVETRKHLLLQPSCPCRQVYALRVEHNWPGLLTASVFLLSCPSRAAHAESGTSNFLADPQINLDSNGGIEIHS